MNKGLALGLGLAALAGVLTPAINKVPTGTFGPVARYDRDSTFGPVALQRGPDSTFGPVALQRGPDSTFDSTF